MALNIRNCESAFLDGKARFERWKAQFRAEWSQPVTQAEIVRFWRSIPPEVHEYLKSTNPQAYEQARELIDEMGGQNGIQI
jgi:hypothetical protein